MVIDTSAIVAILRREPGYESLRAAIANDPDPTMSAASAVELHIVLTRSLGIPAAVAQGALPALGIRVVPFDATQMRLARSAHDKYGRGTGHPARLNFGDCLAYATSIQSGEPLLFVGDDFTHTDVTAAR